jgi:hypothetical protein
MAEELSCWCGVADVEGRVSVVRVPELLQMLLLAASAQQRRQLDVAGDETPGVRQDS